MEGGLQLVFKFGPEPSLGPVVFAMDRYVMWHSLTPREGYCPLSEGLLCSAFPSSPSQLLELLILC